MFFLEVKPLKMPSQISIKTWKYSFQQTSHSILSMSCSSWLIWEPQWLSGSTLTPVIGNEEPHQHWTCQTCGILANKFHPRTCGKHARVGVSGRKTHVLLNATARPFGRPLDGKVLGLLGYRPLREAVVINGLHSTVQGGLQGLQLGGCFPQQEAGHKLAQHRWTLILLQFKKRSRYQIRP